MKDQIYSLAREFSRETHGNSDYHKDQCFIMGDSQDSFVPLSYLKNKLDDLKGGEDKIIESLQVAGFIFSSADFLDVDNFDNWYKHQFNRKLTQRAKREIGILHAPDEISILESVELINKSYEILRDAFIVNNGKNLPVQLGEWYAKVIFGLRQIKSSSQRGFDFYMSDGKRVEVLVHWSDQSSPKGVKLKKSLVELSDYCIIVYVSMNFMIRDVLFLDSSFIARKYATKGHTIFLKDQNVSGYFFSVSSKHFDKVVSKNALMKFSSPQFAMKLDGRL